MVAQPLTVGLQRASEADHSLRDERTDLFDPVGHPIADRAGETATGPGEGEWLSRSRLRTAVEKGQCCRGCIWSGLWRTPIRWRSNAADRSASYKARSVRNCAQHARPPRRGRIGALNQQ